MDPYDALEPILTDILEVIRPLREDWTVRSKIIEELQNVISSIDSFRGATVEPFGSFVSNLFTPWGDLDISIVLENGSHISSAAKKRKQNLLREFLRALRQKGGIGWRRLQFVPNARVPILKFEYGYQSISCDVSIDNMPGLMKSKFLFWINQIDGRFRDMVLLVKEWAKAHNINSPKTGSLNSYSLCLLVVFHFQTCVPAILPPLKEIYPSNVVDDLRGVRITAEEQIKEICNANISRYMSDRYRPVNKSSLAELFISFLLKFSAIHSKAAELGICTFTGQWQDIKSTMRWLPKTYALFVEDPFEQPENTARAVSAGNLERISGAFRTTYNRLVSASYNRASIVGTLVRPVIVNHMSGAPVRNPSYTPLHYPSTHQQVSREMYSSQQKQHQLPNTRQERHSNFFVNQRPESDLRTLNSQHPFQNTRLEKHPNYVTREVQENRYGNTSLERHPNYVTREVQENRYGNTSLERHPNYFANQRRGIQIYGRETRLDDSNKRRQESEPSNITLQRPVRQFHGQGQHMWRPKSDSQGHAL
ncbi:protein HESO1 [Mercurialis annua]|uniref:protein HESO1 n=1 Tax=Mercurialis annua TaxID=3986 RepID=UPI00215E5E72|nr:protein HESO1 [Mercurialis annua]XP_050210629.1 protein HESO1 [Mercurialis annua]